MPPSPLSEIPSKMLSFFPDDPSRKASRLQLAIDLEWYDQTKGEHIKEIGIAIQLVDHSGLQHFHYIVKEHMHMKNQFAKENPEGFAFGESKIILASWIKPVLEYWLMGAGNECTVDLLLYAGKNDVIAFEKNGVNLAVYTHMKHHDVAAIFLGYLVHSHAQNGRPALNGRKLEEACKEIGLKVNSNVFHNAGNDAHFALVLFNRIIRLLMADEAEPPWEMFPFYPYDEFRQVRQKLLVAIHLKWKDQAEFRNAQGHHDQILEMGIAAQASDTNTVYKHYIVVDFEGHENSYSKLNPGGFEHGKSELIRFELVKDFVEYWMTGAGNDCPVTLLWYHGENAGRAMEGNRKCDNHESLVTACQEIGDEWGLGSVNEASLDNAGNAAGKILLLYNVLTGFENDMPTLPFIYKVPSTSEMYSFYPSKPSQRASCLHVAIDIKWKDADEYTNEDGIHDEILDLGIAIQPFDRSSVHHFHYVVNENRPHENEHSKVNMYNFGFAMDEQGSSSELINMKHLDTILFYWLSGAGNKCPVNLIMYNEGEVKRTLE
ncbi:hypothetical protein HDU76_009293, partial [Blyttiomyces sp. JEL0837]